MSCGAAMSFEPPLQHRSSAAQDEVCILLSTGLHPWLSTTSCLRHSPAAHHLPPDAPQCASRLAMPQSVIAIPGRGAAHTSLTPGARHPGPPEPKRHNRGAVEHQPSICTTTPWLACLRLLLPPWFSSPYMLPQHNHSAGLIFIPHYLTYFCTSKEIILTLPKKKNLTPQPAMFLVCRRSGWVLQSSAAPWQT